MHVYSVCRSRDVEIGVAERANRGPDAGVLIVGKRAQLLALGRDDGFGGGGRADQRRFERPQVLE
jgi:hypothetical protein